MRCFFATDLHGREDRFSSLYNAVAEERPDGVFLGGDLLPRWGDVEGFFERWLLERPLSLRSSGAYDAPLFVIMGNDDPMKYEGLFREAHREGAISYVNLVKEPFHNLFVRGYSFVPPSPFLLKDWELYDVSRHVDVGCIPPDEGFRTVEVEKELQMYKTIKDDLAAIVGDPDLPRTIMLFHAPPAHTSLDRVGRDGVMIDHAPVDLHVGSIAIRSFIERCQPLLSLHGHIHESTRMTGSFREDIGRTPCLNGSTDGPELSIIRFDTEDLSTMERSLL